MSVDEDVDLRDLLAQTLDSNGCLAKIRAQLRASVFLALDEDTNVSKQQPFLNNKLKTFLDEPEGRLMFCIVREFLEYFNMDFTISVYEPESYADTGYKYDGRQTIVDELGIKDNMSSPVLLDLIRMCRAKSKQRLDIDLNFRNENNAAGVETKGTTAVSGGEGSSNSFCSESIEESTSENSRNISAAAVNAKQAKETLNNTYVLSANSKSLITTDSTADKSLDVIVEEEKSIAAANEISLNDTNNSNNNNNNDDKVKSTKSDQKIKTKLSVESSSSSSSSPSSQLNKSRGSDILPSLYSKEFKDKTNLKEFEKLFDMEAEYEEDFMSGSDIDLSLHSSANT